MKTTPFTDKHIALGAKMHEFAGYNMPIEYSGIIDEHLTVCNAVGVFDVSHMGEFWVKGPGALPFLQKITSNNVAALAPGKVQYTCFPNEEGGIVDDLLVYQYDPQKYLLVVNASNIEKDWNWCVAHNTEGAELENSSDRTAQLAVQGPKAILALQKLTDIDLSDIPYYTFKVGEFAGEKNVIISNTGYTGAGGFELYFYPDAADMPCHNIVCAQSHGVGRLLAVSLLRLLLPFPALSLSLDDGDECDVYVRRFLVPVQVSRHDVLLSERVGEVFQIVGAPLVQTPLFLYPLHVLVRSRYVDADCPYLVASDFACQPSFF